MLEKDGRPEGYAVYRHKMKWDEGVSNSELEVVEAVALDGRPTAELWRYLLDIDWSARTTASLMPVDHPLWWLLAAPRRMRPRIGDGLWVRLVDVGEALSARGYAADGAGRLRHVDEFCPWNAGRWRVARGRAKRTTAAPQLRLDVERSAPPTSVGSRSRSSSSADGSRSCAGAQRRVRMRCSRPSAPRGAPRSSECAKAIVRPDDPPYDPDILSEGCVIRLAGGLAARSSLASTRSTMETRWKAEGTHQREDTGR